jgi:hypothetical protein
MTSRWIKKLATNAPNDKDLMAKKKKFKDGSDMEEDHAPKPAEKLRVELVRVTHIRMPKREPFTCSLVPPWLRRSKPPCAP